MKCDMTQTCADQLVPFQILHGEMPVTVSSAAYQEAAQWTVVVMHWKKWLMIMIVANSHPFPHVIEPTKTTSPQQILFLLKTYYTPTVVYQKHAQ